MPYKGIFKGPGKPMEAQEGSGKGPSKGGGPRAPTPLLKVFSWASLGFHEPLKRPADGPAGTNDDVQ